MASRDNMPSAFGFSASTSIDNLLAQNLTRRLHLRSSLLDSDRIGPHSLEDILLQSIPVADADADADTDIESDADLEDPEDSSGGDVDNRRRRVVAREEARLEREILKTIRAGDGSRVLKPNSGQSVSIGDSSICVASREEPGSGYRVWEWHGHIMFFDDEIGFDAEYIYGNYFENLPEVKDKKEEITVVEDQEEESDVEEAFKLGGLKDLIAEPKDSPICRVLHRNSLNSGSK